MTVGYEKTVPRGPIAAQMSGPGPSYGLPSLTGRTGHDPRSTHTKFPAYGFGVRHGKFADDASPGPVYKPDDTMTRVGRNGAPNYSLYGRQKDLSTFKPPGPGAYEPEKAGPGAFPKAPSYSMGSRSRYRSMDQIPAPNSYNMPNLLGKTTEGSRVSAPCFSLKGRSKIGGFSEDLQKTPGPGTYGSTDPSVLQRRQPCYSFRPSIKMPGDGTLKPGPGAHEPEKVTINKKAAPSFSFGIRHSSYVAPVIVDVMD